MPARHNLSSSSASSALCVEAGLWLAGEEEEMIPCIERRQVP